MKISQVTKGHGTANDFVLVEDAHAEQSIGADAVRSLTDRRRGLGADGLIRVVRSEALVDGDQRADGADEAVAAGADWFMDYRNADGSTAEMCGNGVRVFAHVLVSTGRATSGEVRVGTRSGLRPARVLEQDGDRALVRVDMGEPRLLGVSYARVGSRTLAGIGIDMGNPHLACVVPELDEESLRALPVDQQPVFDTEFFPEGVNVEIATPVRDGRISMRVHERGAGETMSCGTGIVATAVAALADAGSETGQVVVQVPGGEVVVDLSEGGSALTGPSVLVAEGVFRAS